MLFTGKIFPEEERRCRAVRGIDQGIAMSATIERRIVSANTLKKHILNIYRKLGIRNRVQLFKMIREHDEAG